MVVVSGTLAVYRAVEVWQHIHVPKGFVESENHVSQKWRSGPVRCPRGHCSVFVAGCA